MKKLSFFKFIQFMEADSVLKGIKAPFKLFVSAVAKPNNHIKLDTVILVDDCVDCADALKPVRTA